MNYFNKIEYPKQWLEDWIQRLKKEEVRFYNELMLLSENEPEIFKQIINDIYLINEKNISYEQILAGRKHLKPIQAKHDDLQGEFDL